MPNFTFFTSQAGPGIQANMGADAYAYTFVAQGAVLASTNSNSVIRGIGADQTISVAGQVWTDVNNTILVSGDRPAVSVLSTGSVLNNSSINTAAINLGNGTTTSSLNNAGEVVGGSGVYAGVNFNILNSGRIASQGSGGGSDLAASAAVLVYAPGSIALTGRIDNTGLIEGSVPAAGNFLAGRRVAVVESNAAGDPNGGNALTINNSGTILGDMVLARLEDVVKNTGLIVGNIDTGSDNDFYDGRKGVIDGTVFGGDGNDRLYGGVDDDRLDGGTGNDVLMGGAGADALIGRAGTDTILYTSAKSGVTVNLAKPNLNTGDASGDTFSAIENLTGSRFNDKLTGNAGANVIDGLDGADRMEGGAGNDRYIVDNAGDVVIEANGGGADHVTSSVSFSLAGQFVEQLTLSGSGNINGTGNSLANVITGNSGNNTINGSSGNDTLSGAAGNDVLNGGAGNDTMTGGNGGDFFVFNTALNAATNVDTITDFSVTADTIRIDNAVFAGLAGGTLAAGAFTANASGNAGDASDRIIYETDTGRLFFDADGTGAGAKIRFATLDPGLALTNADFVVI
jgi:serralysin